MTERTVTVEVKISEKTPHAAAAALEAAARAVRAGDVTQIPARFTIGPHAMNISVQRHD